MFVDRFGGTTEGTRREPQNPLYYVVSAALGLRFVGPNVQGPQPNVLQSDVQTDQDANYTV